MIPVVWVGCVAASCTQFQLGWLPQTSISEPLKWRLLGQQFVNDDVITVVMTWLQALDQNFFA
jgi:hypothetical protein